MSLENSFLINRPIAHRGLHNSEFPENSLGAFQNAITNNYPIELDVQLLDDGTVVVFHDETLARVCNTDGYLNRLKKEDLKNLKLNKTNYSIPEFKDVLKLVKGQVPLLIEIKNAGLKVGVLEEKLYDILKSYKGEYAIQSFNPFSVKWFKDHAPEVIRGQLASFFKGDKLSGIKKAILKRMKFNKTVCPHFISYNISDMPNRYLKKYSELPLLAWTIKTEEDFYKAKELGANAIFEGFDIEKAL